MKHFLKIGLFHFHWYGPGAAWREQPMWGKREGNVHHAWAWDLGHLTITKLWPGCKCSERDDGFGHCQENPNFIYCKGNPRYGQQIFKDDSPIDLTREFLGVPPAPGEYFD